jgi:hypothetical protein
VAPILERGCFLRTDGSVALVSTQVAGVLSNRVDTNTLEIDGAAVTIFTSGRFLLPTMRKANAGFVFDESALSTFGR